MINVPSKSLLSVRGIKGCVNSGEYYSRQESFGFFLPKSRCSLKKKSSLRYIPNFFILFPKSRCSLKKKCLHFDSLILDFLFRPRNQTLPKLTQCAAKRKSALQFPRYCAPVQPRSSEGTWHMILIKNLCSNLYTV